MGNQITKASTEDIKRLAREINKNSTGGYWSAYREAKERLNRSESVAALNYAPTSGGSVDTNGRHHAPAGTTDNPGGYQTEQRAEGDTTAFDRTAKTQGTEAEFDASYTTTVIEGTIDSTTFEDYDSALAAAGGNPRRVWTVVESDYPEGEKIWKFDRDGDEEVVTADTFEDACEQVAEAFNDRFDSDDDDEDNQPIDAEFMADYLSGVYTGDQSDYDDEWTPVHPMSILAGNHWVSHLSNLVTNEEWVDEAESYTC
jgi:hypothetical protein